MKKLLLIFLLIFEHTMLAQIAATLTMPASTHEVINKKIDKLLRKSTGNKSVIENSNIDTQNPNTNTENLIIKNLISDRNIVFDIGANNGDWSNQVLLNHKDICIFLFEPINFLVESMRKRFENKNIKIYESAVFSEEKTIVFNYYEKWPQSSSIYAQNWLTTCLEEPKKILVNAISLDKFCVDNKIDHIDFLKIDVEGCELDALNGSSDLLKKRAIDFIQFAYHRAYFGAQISLKQIYNLLTNFKYSIFREHVDGLVYIPQWDDALENYRRSNYIAVANFIPNSTTLVPQK